MASPALAPVTLEGRVVRLEPLAREHLDLLWEAGRYPELWRFSTVPIDGRGDLARYVDEALRERERGVALPFVTRIAATGEVVGSTRFALYVPEHARIEIGWTWITPRWQRSAVNTEAKLLMLRHAFDGLGIERVELKTDALNQASRRAIARIGGVEEGTLRHHMITASGRLRDSVYFSVVRAEWPAVRERLERRLAR